MLFNFEGEIYLISLLVLFGWVVVLSGFLYKTISHYRSLVKGTSGKDLEKILGEILAKTENSQEKIDNLVRRCQEIEKEGRFHIKKVGILRFNPFKDTGGNQSFILALLNEENSGLVLNSLYTRTGSRWYVKRVEKGKGLEIELSKEEEEAIKKAYP